MALNNATDHFTVLARPGPALPGRPALRDLGPVPRPGAHRPGSTSARWPTSCTAAEPGTARWVADAPDGLAPQLTLVDGDESGLERADVVARLTRHLAVAPSAWDPYDNAVG